MELDDNAMRDEVEFAIIVDSVDTLEAVEYELVVAERLPNDEVVRVDDVNDVAE